MTPAHTRRAFFELGSVGVAAWLAGCGSNEGGAQGESTTTTTADPPATGSESTSANASGDGTGSSSDAASSDGTSTQAGESSSPESTDAGESSSSTTDGVLCEPSPGSIEGPFYRPAIPIRSDLDLYGDAGNPVHLRGRVVDGACAPVVDAIVELWHASPVAPEGSPGDQDATYDNGREYRYYGQVATDRDGRYSFDTLQPGWYLNGEVYRPAHFHLKIWSDNVERLTTQLYFEDDPFNAADPWFDPTMVLALAADGTVERDFAI